MTEPAEPYLRYWRHSLADVELRSPDLKEIHPLSEDAVREGRLDDSTVRALFLAAKKVADKKRRGKPPGETEDPPQIPLLVAPFGLRHRFRHGVSTGAGGGTTYAPLWIGARLDREGRLVGDLELGPWIGRGHLAPVGGDRPVLGALEDFDGFLTAHPLPETETWSEFLTYTKKLFAAVTKEDLWTFELDDYGRLPPCGLIHESARGASHSILRLYDALLKEKDLPPLIDRLARGTDKPAGAPATFPISDPDVARFHCAQMGDSFPLGITQRQALHALGKLQEGQVLAVNGPPGTGKTTLLQSVVATLWTQAALAEEPPPVILACAATNRAVTNILDSFDRAGEDATKPLARRWLPDLGSYGIYFPAKHSRNKGRSEAPRHLEAIPGKPWGGLPGTLETREYVHRAVPFYLQQARKALPTVPQSIDEAVSQLHELLQTTHGRLLASIETALELANRRKLAQVDTAVAARTKIEEQRTVDQGDVERLETLRQKAFRAIESLPWWVPFFIWIPPVRHHRDELLGLPFRRRGHQPPNFLSGSLADSINRHFETLLSPVRSRLAKVDRWHQREESLAAVVEELADPSTTQSTFLDTPERLLELLDTTLRHRLFLIAGRYFEGRWLQEMEHLLKEPRKLNAQSRKACRARYQRFALLTPCMVATFYRAPKVFDCYERGASRPLLGGIDLLIVDEAGQTTPEVGAATFALARRALVVGDKHQIEPVWGVTPGIDRGNLEAAGLPTDEPRVEGDEAHRASSGSIMLLARRATALSGPQDLGMFLSEHRRSVPTVISYCNDLIYGGRLEPLRPEVEKRILPAMGWAHINSPSNQRGGSRINRGEARAIAGWLARNRYLLEKHYQRDLREIVAVITPFAAQKWVLLKALGDASLGDVEAGTVHTFQGGEKPVILFSPVYSAGDAFTYFFDRGPNMMNVAVSRAQDSFLVFGDMRLFHTDSTTPSGILAHHLFTSADHEITDVESAQHLLEVEGTTRINTLDGHRDLLTRAFVESHRRVLIVSPYLSPNALEADAVPEAIRAAKERGVEVSVAFDESLARSNLKSQDQVLRVVSQLENAGAKVIPCSRIHNKTLAVDSSWIVEGSFNWLSASREPAHRFQRHEASVRCAGTEAAPFITAAWEEIEEAHHP